ncbi:MAG: preprotein translocase subunit SecG [Candidatus Eisenbacteria bacterium]|uniref:Protein-export membrane protein SecG n=1 Tax=Eiseniibacteriota bacterium TaxID=2212470 RepID=A0A538T5N9_UNCEI|nr:MAG: preprotein translocase subunit SecG [Candidatus Eisenbacteria bacterium]
MSGFVVGFIATIHIVVCLALMASILLQSGKGGGLAGAFGAGSSQTLFGGRGAATFLSRATTTLAVIFFLTSLTLGIQASRSAGGGRSLIQEEARRRGQQRAATEGAGAPTAGAPTPGGPAAPATGAPVTGTGASNPSPTPEAPPAPTPGAPAGGGAPAAGGP